MRNLFFSALLALGGGLCLVPSAPAEEKQQFSDEFFAKKAATDGLAEVAHGRTAMEKATSPEVKRFAQQMDFRTRPDRGLLPLCIRRDDTLQAVQRDEQIIARAQRHKRVPAAGRAHRPVLGVSDAGQQLAIALRRGDGLWRAPYAARPVRPVFTHVGISSAG